MCVCVFVIMANCSPGDIYCSENLHGSSFEYLTCFFCRHIIVSVIVSQPWNKDSQNLKGVVVIENEGPSFKDGHDPGKVSRSTGVAQLLFISLPYSGWMHTRRNEYVDGVEPASCHQNVAGSIPLVCISKCPWARYSTPNCSWCAGRHPAW